MGVEESTQHEVRRLEKRTCRRVESGTGVEDMSSTAGVRVVVVGEAGTGKSSLIIAVATDSFPDKSPPVLPPTRLPNDFYPDRVPVTIIDTSSRYSFFLSEN